MSCLCNTGEPPLSQPYMFFISQSYSDQNSPRHCPSPPSGFGAASPLSSVGPRTGTTSPEQRVPRRSCGGGGPRSRATAPPFTHSPLRSVHAGVQRETSTGRHHVAAPSDSPRILSPRHGVAAAPLPATASPPRFPSTRRHHLFLNFPAEVAGLSSAPQDTRTRRPRHPQVLLYLDLTRILTLDLQYFTSRHMLDFVGNRFMMSGLFCFSTLFLPLYLLHQLEYSTKMFLLRYAYRVCTSGFEFSYMQINDIKTSILRPQGNIRSYLWIGGKTKGAGFGLGNIRSYLSIGGKTKGAGFGLGNIRSYLSIGGKTKGAGFGLGNIRSCLWIGGKTKGAGFGLDAITLSEPWRRRLYCVTMIRACPGQGKIESGKEAKLESHGIWVHLIARDGRD